MNKEYDVIIVGAGIVGLTLATILAQHAFKIAVVDTQKISLHEKTNVGPEVIAIHLASQRILDRIGAWSFMRPSHYTALRKIIAYDAIDKNQIEFDSKLIRNSELGFIADTQEIRNSLYRTMQNTDVDFFEEKLPLSTDIHTKHALLQCGETLQGSLIVGADGVNSWVRKQLNISFSRHAYNQEAIIAIAHTQRSHENVAYQHFSSTGPIGLLPLPDPNHMALIWSADLATATAITSMDEENFNLKLTPSFEKHLGKLQVISSRIKIPLHEQHTIHTISNRAALIGDAAHRIHPLAGQGANLGFLDAACLAETLQLAREKSQDLGSLKTLRRFERWRKLDNDLMRWTTRGFKEIFEAKNSCLINTRNLGMRTANHLTFVKKYLMNYAAGNREDLPTLAQY